MSGSAQPVPDPAAGIFQTEGEAILFGFDPAPLEATIRARPRSWRVGGALRTLGIAAVVAPMLAAVPPHAPWVIGALVGGGILARRRLAERFTLLSIQGTCPKCGAVLHVKSGRLREPHPLPCEECHHEGRLRLPDGALRAHAAD